MELSDKELVDEFEKLQNVKNELEKRIEDLRKVIITLARQKNTEIVYGTYKKCSIKPYTKVIYPEDKEPLIHLLKNKGLYEQVSSINYLKLGSKIAKKEIDKEIINLTKQEQAFRVSLIDMGI